MRISSTTGMLASRHSSDAHALQALARAGFQACDFSMWNYGWEGGLFSQTDAQFDAYFTGLKATADACGLTIDQTHAPFPSTTGDAAEDAARLAVLKRAIRATSLLGCGQIIIHPALHTGCIRDAGHEVAMETNISMYRALIPDCAQGHVKIAVENMFAKDPQSGELCKTFLSTAEEMVALLDALGAEYFCACLDIGHAQLLGESPAGMALTLGKWLQALHVHDNDGMGDQHNLPFLGTVDFQAVAQALAQVGYAGTLSLEADGFLDVFPGEIEAETLVFMAATARALAERVEAAR